MIITRTPLRISFVGGGSDLKNFYEIENGSVITSSIDKYIYLSMHKLFSGNQIFLKYSKSEYIENIEQIKHPIIKEVFNEYKINGVDFNSSSDIPAGTGLGSSSAFTVGLIKLCQEYLGLKKSNYWIAEEACQVEIEKLKDPIGKQDQFGCALGGINQLIFNRNGVVDVIPINIKPEKISKLNSNLFLFYTGKTRSASKILKVQNDNLKSVDKINVTKKMVKLADQVKYIFENGDIDDFGNILNQGWNYKKSLAKNISNKLIEEMYDFGISSGSSGGKLLGAGGGGFILFYCEKQKQKHFLNKMKSHFKLINFKFDFEGSKTKKI